MYALQDANIHNLAVRGMFDDCQDLVKQVNADAAFKARHRIGAVNSINWARVAAQVVYYFKGYFARDAQRRRAGRLRGALGQLRQHLRRLRRARDGAADRAADPRHQRERRAGRVLPHRALPRAARGAGDLQPVDGHLQGVQFRALRVRPRRDATARACARCGRRLDDGRRVPRCAPGRGFRLGPAARTPIASRRSAWCTRNTASPSIRTPPTA